MSGFARFSTSSPFSSFCVGRPSPLFLEFLAHLQLVAPTPLGTVSASALPPSSKGSKIIRAAFGDTLAHPPLNTCAHCALLPFTFLRKSPRPDYRKTNLFSAPPPLEGLRFLPQFLHLTLGAWSVPHPRLGLGVEFGGPPGAIGIVKPFFLATSPPGFDLFFFLFQLARPETPGFFSIPPPT